MKKLLRCLLLSGFALLLSGCKDMALLDPKGIIALAEKHILIDATLLMLIVVVPVIIMSFVIPWRYREKNTKATYKPEWCESMSLEAIWWGIPCVIIGILAVIVWITSHSLDPYKPINIKGKQPITIQAVALDWRWLFIYPKQGIASMNYLEIPAGVPISFQITADAPMNSFAIPRLAGQIYAMTGMQSRLHLVATDVGLYRGQSTNYSGDGFSGMHFPVRVVTEKNYNAWVKTMQQSPNHLSQKVYNQLALPSEDDKQIYFSNVENDLFRNIIAKYMGPMLKKHHRIGRPSNASAAANNQSVKTTNTATGNQNA